MLTADDRRPPAADHAVDARTGSGASAASGRRLRVLLAVHTFFPDSYFGTERYTFELARGLQELGQDVTVLTVGPKAKGSPGGLTSEYEYQGIPVVALGGSYLRQGSFEDSFARNDLQGVFLDVLADLQPDLVHACHLINLTPSFLLAAHRAHLPIVLTLTDFWGFCWAGQLTTLRQQRACDGPDPDAANCIADYFDAKEIPTTSRLLNLVLDPLRGRPVHGKLINALGRLPERVRTRLTPEIDPLRRRGAFFRDCYGKADALIAPSQHLLDTYVAQGFPREKFHKIPYGIALPDPEEHDALRRRFSDERPAAQGVRFGYMGQIAPHKGVLQLLEAFQRAAVDGATLSIHGNLAQEPSYTKQLRERSGGDDRVCLAGPYESHDIYKVFAGIDVLVVPSLWHENAPFVLLSALATRTPVVIPRARGMVEFVRPGENGLIYEMHDTEGLAACLRQLGSDRELLWRMAKDEQATALSQLDCARATLEVYEQALARPHAVAYPHQDDRIEPMLIPVADGATSGNDLAETADHSHAALLVLTRARAQGFEVRMPRPGGPPAAPPARRRRRPNRPFLPVRKGLRLSYHTKPYLSLWSHTGRRIRLGFHPAFADASQLEIVARGNRGDASLLRYEYEAADGTRASGELRVAWPKTTWSRLVVPLVTRRGKCALRALDWTPVASEGRSPLKLDVLSIAFQGESHLP